MWIKSLDTDVWINMIHITHFSIKEIRFDDSTFYVVEAFLDASAISLLPPTFHAEQDQASLTVHRGTHEECEQFVKDQTFLHDAYQWIGYLAAGLVGAIITLIFT